jgi:Domain of unknown function (DUF4276)
MASMNRIVFLLEEYSMKVLLEGLLPRLFPGMDFLCVAHEGKQDLEKSIPRKLKAWKEPGVRFLILRDNDGGDCSTLKNRLAGLCSDGNRTDSVIRIACQELEAWYLGELQSLGKAYDVKSLQRFEKKQLYRDPDSIQNPSYEVERLIPEFQKVSGARKMALHLSREGNRSRSFQVLIEGIRMLVERVQI